MNAKNIATEHREALAALPGWNVGPVVDGPDGSFSFSVAERVTAGGRRGRDRIVIPAHTRTILTDGSLVVSQVG